MNRTAIVAYAVVTLVAGFRAQVPSFGGRWLLDYALTDSACAKLGIPPDPHGVTSHLTITLTKTELTTQLDNHPVHRFKLDGSASENALENGETMVSHARLEAGQLYLTSKSRTVNVSTVYTVDGDVLTEIRTIPSAGSTERKSVSVYRRER